MFNPKTDSGLRNGMWVIDPAGRVGIVIFERAKYNEQGLKCVTHQDARTRHPYTGVIIEDEDLMLRVEPMFHIVDEDGQTILIEPAPEELRQASRDDIPSARIAESDPKRLAKLGY